MNTDPMKKKLLSTSIIVPKVSLLLSTTLSLSSTRQKQSTVSLYFTNFSCIRILYVRVLLGILLLLCCRETFSTSATTRTTINTSTISSTQHYLTGNINNWINLRLNKQFVSHQSTTCTKSFHDTKLKQQQQQKQILLHQNHPNNNKNNNLHNCFSLYSFTKMKKFTYLLSGSNRIVQLSSRQLLQVPLFHKTVCFVHPIPYQNRVLSTTSIYKQSISTTTAFSTVPTIKRRQMHSSFHSFQNRMFAKSGYTKKKSKKKLTMTVQDSSNNGDNDELDTDKDNFIVEYSNTESDTIVTNRTMEWIQRIVIGMNLCPFAEKSLKLNQIEIIIVRGNNEEEILQTILDKMFYRETVVGTTIIVCPDLYCNDFINFWNVYQLIEHGLMMEYKQLQGSIQVAPFHPLFRFEQNSDNNDNNNDNDNDDSNEDVGDWTNRSTYPIFHILREEEVSAAVEKINGDASKVWLRNVNLLHELDTVLGHDVFVRYMKLDRSSTGSTSSGSSSSSTTTSKTPTINHSTTTTNDNNNYSPTAAAPDAADATVDNNSSEELLLTPEQTLKIQQTLRKFRVQMSEKYSKE